MQINLRMNNVCVKTTGQYLKFQVIFHMFNAKPFRFQKQIDIQFDSGEHGQYSFRRNTSN